MQGGTNFPQEMIYLWRSFLLGELAKLRKATFPFSCPSDRSSAWNSGSTAWIFIKFELFFKNLMTKLISHKVQYTQLTIYCSLLLRMRNISDKLKRKSNAHLSCNNFFLIHHAVYDIMWKNNIGPGMPQLTIWSMYIACRIPWLQTRNQYYVILLAVPLQQWFHIHTSILHYTYITCL